MDLPAWSNGLLALAFIGPAEALFTYYLARLLPVRKKLVFWTVRMAIIAACLCVRSALSPGWMLLSWVVSTAVLPLACSRGPLSRRVLILASCIAVQFAVEVVGMGLWAFFAADVPMGYESMRTHFSENLFLRALCFALIVLLFETLCRIVDRTWGRDEDGDLAFLWAFPIMQCLLLIVALAVGQQLDAGTRAFYATCSVFVFWFLVFDAMFFRAVRSYGEMRRKVHLADLMQRRLDEPSSNGEEIVANVEKTARFRHDVRNQLQVVQVLANRGEVEEARSYLQELKRGFEDKVA